ncbi:MAG: lamin tail domain-containing protein, partial [Planctomycetota bacterium]
MLKLMKTSFSACPRGDAPPKRDASWHWRGRLSALSLVFIAFLAGSTVAQSQLVGDLNRDYKVDFKDLRTFAWQWLNPDCHVLDCIADLDDADGVNMVDLALLANNWLMEEPHLVISEFMASNASAEPLEEGELLDGNDESSDWLEIYNPSGASVSLDGWYLTDSDANLTMWQFPDGLEIRAGEFLVIFASGKTYEENPLNYPYLDSAGYYHTNFELNQDGDYLALVASGSTIVVHEYRPQFPDQLTDISYGLAQHATALVPTGATATYHVPTSGDEGTDWTAPNFDDSGWGTEETGLGFGRAIVETGQDIGGPSIPGSYSYDGGVYTVMGDGDDIWDISDSFYYVFRPLTGDGELTARVVGVTYTDYWAKAGVMIRETLTGSSKHAMMIITPSFLRAFQWRSTTNYNSLSGDIYSMPYWVRIKRTGDSFTGYYAPDVGGSPGAWSVQGSTFISMAEEVYIGLCVTSHSSGALCTTEFDNVTVSGVTNKVEEDMLGVNASLWIRIEFDLEEGQSDIFDALMLRMKYEDGFTAYLNGVEVASCNAPNPVQWDSTADSDRLLEDALVFKEISIMDFVDTLQTGRNVLAIHGLNDDKNNDEFLILPELVAASNINNPQYFTTPTPGMFNIAGAEGIVSDVWFSHKRGFYDTPFQLMLSTAMDYAEIRYTFDGSRPTIMHGLTYTGPFDVNETSTIRAVAVEPGWLDSEVETHTYIFLDDVVTQSPSGELPGPNWPASRAINNQKFEYGMDTSIVNNAVWGPQLKGALVAIPTMSIVTDLFNLFDYTSGIYVNAGGHGEYWERPTSVELINPDGSEGFQIDAGLRIRGGYSRSPDNPKHAFRFFFRSVYGAGKLNYPLFGEEGVDAFDKVDLRTAQNYSWSYANDSTNTMCRDVWARDTQGLTGQAYTRSRYYHLYINGQYWGIFQTQERPEAAYGASYFGGDREEWDCVKATGPNANYTIEATDGTLDYWQDLWNLSNTLPGATDTQRKAIYLQMQGLNSDGTRNPSYPVLLDVDNLIDYMIMVFYDGDRDAPISNFLGNTRTNNWYGIRNQNGEEGFRYFVHDAEHIMSRGLTNRTGPYLCGNQFQYSNPQWIHQRLMLVPEYRLRFADHVHKHLFNGGLLMADAAIGRFQARAQQIDMAIIAESARWGSSTLNKDTWQSAISNEVTGFFPNRTSTIINQLKVTTLIDGGAVAPLYPSVSAPSFNQHGGEVSSGFNLTMGASSGNIYYTTHGSDPREAWTGNPVGTLYAGPVTLNKSTCVKARVLDGSTWSALNEAIFAIGHVADDLRVTEIMYHPKYTGDPNDPNTEFIELKNIGPGTLYLNLVRFTEGIHFTFPDVELASGGQIVVVKDITAFDDLYDIQTNNINVAGRYTGSLANDGERIKLVDAIGRTILDFDYEDGWCPITDGDGFSLTMIGATDSALYGWDKGLVSHWKFDDGSGDTAIDSAGTNNGTLNGDPTWTGGRIDGALSFDGNSDYVEVNDVIVPLAGDNFTAQAWIRLSESAGTWNPVLLQHDPYNKGYHFYVASSRPSFFIEDSSSVQAVSPETINTDQWYHVAATNDGSTLKLYVDGRLKDSTSSTGLTGVNHNAYIGGEPNTTLYYTGLIDDVRIYDRAVSESEFLDIADPTGRWSRKDSWRASVYRNGSPGSDDSGILPDPGAVVINEVMSHSNAGPDWIELYNTTDEAI